MNKDVQTVDTIENFSFWNDPSVAITLWKYVSKDNSEEIFYVASHDILLSEDPIRLVALPIPFGGENPLEVIKDAKNALSQLYERFYNKVRVIDADTVELLDEEYLIDDDNSNDGESE